MNTLQVIGAIVLLSFTGLSMQRHQVGARQSQMRTEIEMRATGQATLLLDRLATLPFDANLDLGNVAQLTQIPNLGRDLRLDQVQFLPQADGLQYVATTPSNTGTLEFDVEVSVRFMQELNGRFEPSIVPTVFREVTVRSTSALNTKYTVRRIYAAI
ncbi:hypothetical protein BH23BAC4_BH23BAC4_11070 [soil metagenome]